MSNQDGRAGSKAGMSMLEKYKVGRLVPGRSVLGGIGRQGLMCKGIATKCAPPVEGQEGKENEMCGEVGGGAISRCASAQGTERRLMGTMLRERELALSRLK
jgi:hypothetical protein